MVIGLKFISATMDTQANRLQYYEERFSSSWISSCELTFMYYLLAFVHDENTNFIL